MLPFANANDIPLHEAEISPLYNVMYQQDAHFVTWQICN